MWVEDWYVKQKRKCFNAIGVSICIYPTVEDKNYFDNQVRIKLLATGGGH